MARAAEALLLMVACVLAISNISAVSGRGFGEGPWQPITNVSTTDVQNNAQFAVTEINALTKINYAYIKVLSGETKVAVGGTKYRLRLLVKDTLGVFYTFETLVYYVPSTTYRKLLLYWLVPTAQPPLAPVQPPAKPPTVAPVKPPALPPVKPPVLPPVPSPTAPFKPITDVNSPQVQTVAIFAVIQINIKTPFFSQYFYVNVISGQIQESASGVTYRLLISVKNLSLGFNSFKTVQVVVRQTPTFVNELVSYTFVA